MTGALTVPTEIEGWVRCILCNYTYFAATGACRCARPAEKETTTTTTMPAGATLRKETPVASGVLDYFPDALIAIAHVSFVGNEQHNPGTPLHWDRSKSTDEADALIRHFLQRGTEDTDGLLHSAKMAWRALALLQKELEANNG